MSIATLAAQAATNSIENWQLFLAVGAGAAGIFIASVAGAFRSQSVLGPTRLDQTDQPVRVWAIVLLALAALVIVQSAYIAMRFGTELKLLANNPDARAKWKMPAGDTIVLSSLVPLVAFMTMLIADRIVLRDGIQKLGLSVRSARRGLIGGLVGALVALPLTFAAATIVQWMWMRWNFTTPESHQLLTLLHDQSSLALRALIVFIAVIVAPAAEELLFRGHLQTAIAHTLRAWWSASMPPHAASSLVQVEPPWIRWLAIVLASATFAAVHDAGAGSRWMLPPLFLLAVCFGYAYERTGSLWAPMLMHAAFNGLSIAFALLGGV